MSEAIPRKPSSGANRWLSFSSDKEFSSAAGCDYAKTISAFLPKSNPEFEIGFLEGYNMRGEHATVLLSQNSSPSSVYAQLMPLCPEDVSFLTGPFQSIEGWCIDEAAWLTTYLIRLQQAENHLAPSFEIGVYKGKYLSVIQNCARQAGMDVIGFDTYEWVPSSAVEDSLRTAFGSLDGIQLIQGDSTQMTPAILNGHLGGRKAGFVSVDGAHTPDAVFSDLLLCETALEPWGIVSIDDFLNPMAIGVTEGAMRFWYKSDTNLVPFCYCRNKLFAASKEFAAHYSEHTLRFCEENQHLPAAKKMIEYKTVQGLHWAKQEFLGQHIWIV
jgi:hypothetical protein